MFFSSRKIVLLRMSRQDWRTFEFVVHILGSARIINIACTFPSPKTVIPGSCFAQLSWCRLHISWWYDSLLRTDTLSEWAIYIIECACIPDRSRSLQTHWTQVLFCWVTLQYSLLELRIVCSFLWPQIILFICLIISNGLQLIFCFNYFYCIEFRW